MTSQKYIGQTVDAARAYNNQKANELNEKEHNKIQNQYTLNRSLLNQNTEKKKMNLKTKFNNNKCSHLISSSL